MEKDFIKVQDLIKRVDNNNNNFDYNGTTTDLYNCNAIYNYNDLDFNF